MAEEKDSESKSKEWKVSAVDHFVLSAKLNPSNGAAFRYLGHYYGGVSADKSRAAKCYQRAVSINPDDYEAGVSGYFLEIENWNVMRGFDFELVIYLLMNYLYV